MLDLLLAAGLLRLVADPAWDRMGTLVAILVVRQRASAGLQAVRG
ncbi:MAG TPA: hypothetical protein VLO09_02275 [Ornithinimicrobium sp.]|nr:hypothetical protein [Ornithinimicrobium sp.]